MRNLGQQLVPEITAAGCVQTPADPLQRHRDLQFRGANNQPARPGHTAHHPCISEALAMAAGAGTGAGAWGDRAGGRRRMGSVRRDAIDAEKAKPNADMIQSSAARRVW